MSLEIIQQGNWNVPVTRCESCESLIESTLEGLVLFPCEGGKLRFVHRGECDAVQRRANASSSWMPLGEFLYLLSANLKVDHRAEEQQWKRRNGIEGE